jgi:hypothetical protein
MLSYVAAAFVMLVATRDAVPSFNLEPVCRETAERIDAPEFRRDCLRDEREARDQLKARWKDFPRADRSYCSELASLAGISSYVQLLTCLEIEQAVRRAREDKPKAGTDASQRRANGS